jgi:hypothetical protein
VGEKHGGAAANRIAVMASRGYGFVMKRPLKISGPLSLEPADECTLKEALANLTRARKLVCRSLTASIAEAGPDPEPSDEARSYIDAHFKLLALVMAQVRDIDAVLGGK